MDYNLKSFIYFRIIIDIFYNYVKSKFVKSSKKYGGYKKFIKLYWLILKAKYAFN